MSEQAATIPTGALRKAPWLLDGDRVGWEYKSKTMAQISDEYGITKRAVARALSMHGYEPRKRGEPPPGITIIELKQMHAKLLKGGLAHEVGIDMSCSDCPEREECYTPGHVCVCAPERNGNNGAEG